MNLKKTLIIVVGSIAGLALLFVFINSFLTSYTNDLLRKKLSETNSKLYHINYEDLSLNIINGEILLTDISMRIDTNFADTLKQKNSYPSFLYSGAVGEIRLNGINAFDIYFNKVIRVNTLFIDQPEVDLIITHSNDSVDSKKLTTGSSIKALLEYLNHSKINSVSLKNGSLNVHSEHAKGIRKIGSADSFKLEIRDFEIDSAQPQYPYLVKEVAIGFQNAQFDVSPEYYMEMGAFGLSLKDSNVTARELKVIPKQSKKDFAARFPYIKSQIDLSLSELTGSAIDFRKMIFDGQVTAKLLELKNGKLGLYRDRTKDWPGNHYPTVSEMIQSIPFPVTINELKVVDFEIDNEQTLAQHEPPAILNMSKCFLSLFNVSNDSAQLSQNTKLEVALQMKMLNTTTIRGNMQFELLDPSQTYECNFNIGKTSLLPFNPLLKRFMHIELASGELNEGKVVLQGNSTTIIGITELDYKNATISLSDQKQHTGFLNQLKNNLLSGIANTIIKNDNVKGTKDFRTGTINYQYNRKLPFVRNLWLASQEGIVSTMIPFPHKL